MAVSEITYETASRLLRYDAKSGFLFWKERPRSDFYNGGIATQWQQKFAGRVAGSIGNRGYVTVKIAGKLKRAHRIVWLLHYGEMPKGEIDHVDHDRSNNRIENLRDVSSLENHRNLGMAKNNTSGQTGIYWNKQTRRWSASVWRDQKKVHLGYFSSKEDASNVRNAATAMMGYHPNHGT